MILLAFMQMILAFSLFQPNLSEAAESLGQGSLNRIRARKLPYLCPPFCTCQRLAKILLRRPEIHIVFP